MRRREFIALVTSAPVWPLAAGEQQPERMRRIGVLMGNAETDPQAQSEITAFRQGLQKLGWAGRNVRIAYRWAGGESMRTLAKELIALEPDALLAVSTPAVAALMNETRIVPIVFVRVADPLGDAVVDSMAKPSGNVTGLSVLEPSIAGKWLQLLREIAPRVARVTVMFNPTTAPYRAGSDFLRVAQADMEVKAAHVHDAAEFEPVIAAVAREGNGSLICLPDIFVTVHRKLTIELTARYRVPALYQYRFFTDSGGLISYGTDVFVQYARAAEYIDRILKGAKVSDLPVQAPTKYELVINLKTAGALGLDVPEQLLQRADELIE